MSLMRPVKLPGSDLLYPQNIPASELSVAVISIPFRRLLGRDYRAQVKTHHAMKFNHICEQKFKN